MRLWHRRFPVNFAKFLRTPFSYRTPPVAASANCTYSLFLFAKSKFNQRIESWWSFFRHTGLNSFWFFCDENTFDESDVILFECLYFCSLRSIQDYLFKVKKEWHQPKIRSVQTSKCPASHSVILYCTENENDKLNKKSKQWGYLASKKLFSK